MELKALAAALVGLLQPTSINASDPGNSDATGNILIAHKDLSVVDLEQFRGRPKRIRQTFAATGIPSFVDYVNRYKDEDSTIFITPDLTQLANGAKLATAVLDYHQSSPDGTPQGENEARWGDHAVTLFARPSLPYSKLLALDGKLMDQPSFAQALEDIARFSNSHAAADLVEIARTISLTSKGDFKSFEDELSGSVDFKFDLAVKASAGTQTRSLTVPSVIGFAIPLIDGLSPTTVNVKFLYRVPDGPGGKVHLGVKIVDRTWLEDAAINEAKAMIEEQTGLPVYVGNSTSHYDD